MRNLAYEDFRSNLNRYEIPDELTSEQDVRFLHLIHKKNMAKRKDKKK